MALFQTKIVWKRSRKRENKIKKIVPISSCPARNRKLKKNSKNIQKN